MSKPNDIPQDVWDAADGVWSICAASNSTQGIAHIARAILAAKTEERRDCLGIIENIAGTPVGTAGAKDALGHAHSAIRARAP